MFKLIKREYIHYKTLPLRARLIFWAFNLRQISYPIISIFLDAFIWRSTSSLTAVIVYNLGIFTALPLGFLLNGQFLKKWHVTTAHFVGLLFTISSTLAVVLLPTSSSLSLFVLGILFGLGNGIYWSSRNYLTFQETTSTTRTYFYSILSVFGSITGMVVSFVVGWFIAFGELSRLYTPFMAYVYIMLFAFICLLAGGGLILRKDLETPKIVKIWQWQISKRWWAVRLMNLSVGLFENITSVICALLILNFLGKEGILGTISAIVGIFTIILYYLYGRWAKHGNQHQRVLILALGLSFILALLLAFVNNNLAVLVYVLLASLPIAFYWLVLDPWQLNVMDTELGANHGDKYPLVVDCEIFLNIGRVISLVFLLLSAIFWTGTLALKITPIILSTVQIILFILIWQKLNFINNK